MAKEIRTEVREGVRNEQRLTRKKGLSTDKFHVPDNLKQPGMSYEWKRMTNMGMPDREHQVGLAENHWKPVQTEEMPGMMPNDYSGAIERGGQVLMSRPSYLTEEAQNEVLDISQQRVRTQEKRLGMSNQGEAPRTRPNISKEYGPLTADDKRSVQTIPE